MTLDYWALGISVTALAISFVNGLVIMLRDRPRVWKFGDWKSYDRPTEIKTGSSNEIPFAVKVARTAYRQGRSDRGVS